HVQGLVGGTGSRHDRGTARLSLARRGGPHRACGNAPYVQLRHRHGCSRRSRPGRAGCRHAETGGRDRDADRIDPATTRGRRRSLSRRARPVSVPRRRVAVLISGRGSNLQALMRAAADPEYPAEIVLVLSSRADAGGLGLARAAGIEALVFSAGDYPDAPEREKGMHAALVARQIDLVCLAGYMRILSPEFVQLW